MDPAVERNLLPLALVKRARALTLKELVRELDVPLLLVKLDDPDGELAQSLSGMTAGASTRGLA